MDPINRRLQESGSWILAVARVALPQHSPDVGVRHVLRLREEPPPDAQVRNSLDIENDECRHGSIRALPNANLADEVGL